MAFWSPGTKTAATGWYHPWGVTPGAESFVIARQPVGRSALIGEIITGSISTSSTSRRNHTEVSGLSLSRDYDIVDYDGERLVLLCPPTEKRDDLTRELVIIDIASAKVADRFVLKGYTHIFHNPIGHTPDGWLILDASLVGENNEHLYKQAITRIHPLTREVSFELFPPEESARVLISPSGQHVLKGCKILRPELGLSTEPASMAGIGEGRGIYERSIEVWAGNPLRHVGTLPFAWAN
jgi:hypothetical protein